MRLDDTGGSLTELLAAWPQLSWYEQTAITVYVWMAVHMDNKRKFQKVLALLALAALSAIIVLIASRSWPAAMTVGILVGFALGYFYKLFR